MGKNDNNREWNPRFIEYTEYITAHPSYNGLYFDRDRHGRINWVVTGKSEKGKLRQQWWDKKCHKLGIPIRKGCYAIAARTIHPTKKHVCQCCGRELSIYYEYPNKNLIARINKGFQWELRQTDKTIGEIIEKASLETNGLARISRMLLIPKFETSEETIAYVYRELVFKESKKLSPGVMCNPPDRFDGFHSDGLCCREEKDKGRHPDNMKTYVQDRRAYEEWSDGNWNLANRLMGEYAKGNSLYTCPQCGEKRQMTADHIGPISLGFCHSRNFQPLCRSCNSSKNNRFSYEDVRKLIELENSGEQVASWHSKSIWNLIKLQVKNDEDAKIASSVMVRTHQNILRLLSQIYKVTGQSFLLRFLHPEYAEIDYRFKNFDPLDLTIVR